MSYGPQQNKRFVLAQIIATGTGNTTLQAAPAADEQLVVQSLTVAVTVSAAQAFTIGDGTITLFAAPASLAVGTYAAEFGPMGKALTAATALSFTATAGNGVTISGFGYVRSTSSG